jgi:putative RNA methylase family UPF0020
MKTSIARALIEHFTRPGDVLIDPFAGSGVIPFEASLQARVAVAGDTNPYGVLLMRAKFAAPVSCDAALVRFERRWEKAQRRIGDQDLRCVPLWIRRFFHPETLRNALALRDELVDAKDHFLLACLLGILHHQRPGFLSYPSSHLVPYLRNRLFPRHRFANLYQERDVPLRMLAKIRRTYRRPPPSFPTARIYHTDARCLPAPSRIDAVITSPPYMNELDYVRDNRLRLWFLGRGLPQLHDISRRNREEHFSDLLRDVFSRLLDHLAPSAAVVIIVGDTRRGSRRVDASRIVKQVFAHKMFASLTLEEEIHDRIPDIRRSRRDLSGTKRETILAYRLSERATNRAEATS